MSIDSKNNPVHTIQFCCGTTCDSAANLAYVKELEMELKAAKRTIRMLRRNNGLASGHTEGVVR